MAKPKGSGYRRAKIGVWQDDGRGTWMSVKDGTIEISKNYGALGGYIARLHQYGKQTEAAMADTLKETKDAAKRFAKRRKLI